MIYKPFQDLKLSWLGMGVMRMPKAPGQGEKIDEARATELIDRAYASGINYYDTAYRYHAGESERFIGKALSRYPRDSYYLASKMPGHMMTYEDGAYRFTGLLSYAPARTPAEILQEQLEKCRTDYFDFYLLHNLCETSYDFYTSEEIGLIPFLLEQKQRGVIRHLGFSAHCTPETLDRFLNWSKERFGGPFEFVQIQINYMDWALQQADKKYDIIARHGLPIISMEPCRGGRLVSLGEQSDALLKRRRPDDSIASWAFRYLQALPNVLLVLSGMSTMEQLEENVAIFSKHDPVTPEDRPPLDRAIEPLLNLVPCTACRYCCEDCPQGLDIPKLIALYNEASNGGDGVWTTLGFTLDAMAPSELPSACINCGACTQICPQAIDIPEVMRKFDAVLSARKK